VISWRKIRPVVVDHIDVCIHGLDREKAGQPSPSSPADDQVHPGHVGRSHNRAEDSVSESQIPLKTVVYQKVHFHTAGSESLSGGIGKQFPGKHGRAGIAQDQKPGIFSGQTFHSPDTGFGEGDSLSRMAFGVVHGESVESQFFHSQVPADIKEFQAGRDAVVVSVFFCEALSQRPSAVAVGDDADVFWNSGHICVSSFPWFNIVMESIDRTESFIRAEIPVFADGTRYRRKNRRKRRACLVF